MKYDIIIFGGGISGLTIAHELVKKGFKILIIEKDEIAGGMARSRREKGNVPSEHSFRGYTPFYKNTYQIMKEISYKNKTVYDNLKHIYPYDFKDTIVGSSKRNYSEQSLKDIFIFYYYETLVLFSNKRRNKYYTDKIEPIFKKKLSKAGYKHFINYKIGPALGMHKPSASLGHYMKIYNSFLGNVFHDHEDSGDILDNWWGVHVLNNPTSEVWFDPWIEQLNNSGVDILYNSELTKLNWKDNSILSCDIKTGGIIKTLHAKEYIVATNPFNAEQIFYDSQLTDLYKTFHLINKKTKSIQISFRIGLNIDIQYPENNIFLTMTDSEFTITWYPQEKIFADKLPYKSLWSGTLFDHGVKGKLFGKSPEYLTKEELKQEIIYQILRSKSFQKLIYDNNNFYITKNDIDYIEIWYEWEYINGKQEAINKKWVNNIYNEKYRPGQKTKYDNLYLSGAHTKTTINIWSMEGAVESGKLTSNFILEKYKKSPIYYYKHDDNILIKMIQCLDDILYALKLPNIVNIVLLFIFIWLIFYLKRKSYL